MSPLPHNEAAENSTIGSLQAIAVPQVAQAKGGGGGDFISVGSEPNGVG